MKKRSALGINSSKSEWNDIANHGCYRPWEGAKRLRRWVPALGWEAWVGHALACFRYWRRRSLPLRHQRKCLVPCSLKAQTEQGKGMLEHSGTTQWKLPLCCTTSSPVVLDDFYPDFWQVLEGKNGDTFPTNYATYCLFLNIASCLGPCTW